MPAKKTFFERLVDRLEFLDRQEVGDHLINLAREKGLLESIFNSMREGLMVIDPRQRIVFINNSASILLDLSPECIGRFAAEIIRDPSILDIIQQSLKLPDQSLVKEFEVIQPRPGWIRLSRSSLRDKEGNFKGIMLLFSDISRERKAEEEVSLVKRLDFLSYLTAAVAHELGNPLNALSIHIQLIERLIKKLNKKQQKELLKAASIIKEEIDRLDKIVDQFLQALRPTRFHLSEENLPEIVEEVLTLVGDELKEKGIRVVKEAPAGEIKGGMDKDLIKQVILNLIKNAAQSMPRGGKIRVKTEQENAYLKLSVTDQGEGIPSEKIPRIFEPFFTTKESGSGLGLLVVYKIIRQHGGGVEIKSRSGRGTTFTIWLPQRPSGIKLLPSTSHSKTQERG